MLIHQQYIILYSYKTYTDTIILSSCQFQSFYVILNLVGQLNHIMYLGYFHVQQYSTRYYKTKSHTRTQG